MGAIIKNITVAYKNDSPKTFTVYYSDNGTSDVIQASFNSDLEALGWLNSWGDDTSGGFEHLEYAKKCLDLTKFEHLNA